LTIRGLEEPISQKFWHLHLSQTISILGLLTLYRCPFRMLQVQPKELFTHSKRGAGCSQINQVTYTTTGVTFDLICDTRWNASNYLYLTYTPDFESCITSCATWNKNGSGNCIGVTWIQTMYGPDGETGPSACYGSWNFPGNGYSNPGWDSAIIQNVTLPTVFKSSNIIINRIAYSYKYQCSHAD
jgi:hypothetical protein